MQAFIALIYLFFPYFVAKYPKIELNNSGISGCVWGFLGWTFGWLD